MDFTVSEATARFFFDQIAGKHSGHMAMIPNNPTLHSLMEAHRSTTESKFAEFLKAVATHLEKEQPF